MLTGVPPGHFQCPRSPIKDYLSEKISQTTTLIQQAFFISYLALLSSYTFHNLKLTSLLLTNLFFLAFIP